MCIQKKILASAIISLQTTKHSGAQGKKKKNRNDTSHKSLACNAGFASTACSQDDSEPDEFLERCFPTKCTPPSGIRVPELHPKDCKPGAKRYWWRSPFECPLTPEIFNKAIPQFIVSIHYWDPSTQNVRLLSLRGLSQMQCGNIIRGQPFMGWTVKLWYQLIYHK